MLAAFHAEGSAGRRRQTLAVETGSVAEAGGGTARHTRAWSVGALAVVAGCRRLRFGLGASKVPAVRRALRSWAVSGPSEAAQQWPMTTNDDHQAHESIALTSKNPAPQDPRQDPGQEEVTTA
ncbi:hypothetical protein GCM10009787_00900 [Streptomyces bangladeshensis]|uniref:Uncharacterized protein n=1 Tax=Streptomyces bangladeshensis TaxID=295352 RepID=A0ABP5N4E3_9ACTN